MEVEFKTDLERINFLLEADADLRLGLLAAEGKLEFVSEELPEDERPKYITNFIGSKQKLVDWIWGNTPEDAQSVLDAFSGSSVVGYMYKTKGMQVFSNDRLAYCYHAARAIVENNSTRLSEKDIEGLLKDHNSDAGTFIQKTFHGIFFHNDVLALLDVLRANIDALTGTKKSMALFAMGKTCMSGGGFGHFSSTTKGGQRHYTTQSFIEHYRDNLYRINSLVFDNGKENKAFNGDIVDIAPKVKADLVYFDPPYATQFSSTNYEKYYHFVEGLMDYWKDKEIDHAKKIRNYKIEDPGVTPATAKQFFTDFLTASNHIPNWLISYRDNAYPTESEIKQLVADLGKESRMKSKDHKYQLAGKNRGGEPSNAKERLFVCADAGEDVEQLSAVANMDDIADLSLDADFDPDLLSAIAGKTDNVLVTGFIGNKHFIMNWIDKHFPKDAKSLFDAFSGGANVAYFFKRKGLRVTTNDIMSYPYHIARAVIENNTETISDEELAALLEKNPDAGTFTADTFYGYYYTKPILQFLDNVWANIQKLKGYKKDIALAALGHTCKAKAVFGMFNRSKMNRTRKISDLAEGYRSSSIGNIPVSEFVTAFKKYVRQINGLVYDNGQENAAHNDDILKVLPEVKADVIYCDPPYITEFLRNDYEDYYHFVEGLMSCWKGKEILDTPRRNFASRTKYTKESMRELIGNVVSAAGKKFPHILISYRDKAFPTEKELKGMVADSFGDVRVKRIAVEYNIVKKESDAGGKYANELLFIGKKTAAGASKAEREDDDILDAIAYSDFQMKTQKNSQLTLGHSILHRWFAAGWDSEGNNETTTWPRDQVVTEHTRLHRLALERGLDFSFIPSSIDETLPEGLKKQVIETMQKSESVASTASTPSGNHTTIIGDIRLSDMNQLAAEGISLSDNSVQGDKEFSFILTHAGPNKNGDFFTVEELSTRHQTAINKKIDLKHSQDFTDIVGGIIASDFVQEENKSWVECVGELYVNDNINSRLAYKLIKKGIIAQVSMECDYEEGECSICGKRVRSKADYCLHLKKFKGGEFKGQPVNEILHGITFTGLGLLDRKGADENAKIKQIAEKQPNEGGNDRMDGENKKPDTDETEAAKKAPGDGGGADKDARIKELEKENKDLKAQLDEVQKELDKMREEQAAAARRTRAEKLVNEMMNRGVEFADDEDRESEMNRLAGLTDDAFEATEAAVKRIKKKDPKADPNADQKPEDKNKKPPVNKGKADSGCGMSADAGVRPADVQDGKETSLEDDLKSGFMAAYNERVGAAN
ncbi:MAG: Modification methylase FokI [bacterium ADurb.Bin236]|nr:MAG: Modification methylase FokI [bacterium ADurb.Bin236]